MAVGKKWLPVKLGDSRKNFFIRRLLQSCQQRQFSSTTTSLCGESKKQSWLLKCSPALTPFSLLWIGGMGAREEGRQRRPAKTLPQPFLFPVSGIEEIHLQGWICEIKHPVYSQSEMSNAVFPQPRASVGSGWGRGGLIRSADSEPPGSQNLRIFRDGENTFACE